MRSRWSRLAGVLAREVNSYGPQHADSLVKALLELKLAVGEIAKSVGMVATEIEKVKGAVLYGHCEAVTSAAIRAYTKPKR
jgi:hypothetical protein